MKSKLTMIQENVSPDSSAFGGLITKSASRIIGIGIFILMLMGWSQKTMAQCAPPPATNTPTSIANFAIEADFWANISYRYDSVLKKAVANPDNNDDWFYSIPGFPASMRAPNP